MFKIELTSGAGWKEPAETINWRECATESTEAAIAEALHWLRQTQEIAPARGATHTGSSAGWDSDWWAVLTWADKAS